MANNENIVNVKELASRFVERCSFEISKKDAVEEINLVTALIAEAVANGDTVRLKEFALTTSYRNAKNCKNPRTGEMQEIPAHYSLRVKAFKPMKDKLADMEPPKQAKAAKKTDTKTRAKTSAKPTAKTKGGKKK